MNAKCKPAFTFTVPLQYVYLYSTFTERLPLQYPVRSRYFYLSFCFSFRLALAESELALSESKVNELGSLLERARDQQAAKAKMHQNDLKREREVRKKPD